MSFKKNNVAFVKMFCVIFAWIYLVVIILLPFESPPCSQYYHHEGILSSDTSLVSTSTREIFITKQNQKDAHTQRLPFCMVKADTSWELLHENEECKEQRKKQLAKNQNCLFLDQCYSRENVRIFNKATRKVFFKCRALNFIKFQVFNS